MKKIKILLALILCFTLINVNAKTVKINGNNDDIYESGGSGSAIFDNITNTLTLNGYDSGCIYFDGFIDETVSIVLVGENSISSETYVDSYSAIGLKNGDSTSIEITGEADSSLYLSNYKYGVHVYSGNISIDDVSLELYNIAYVGIYSEGGNIYIEDSIFDVHKEDDFEDTQYLYAICSDEDNVYIDNVTYSSYNTYSDLYGVNCYINDSSFDIKNSSYSFYGTNFYLDNVDIDFIESYYLTYCDEFTIKNSNITFDSVYYLIYSDDLIVLDSVTISGDDASDLIYSNDYGLASIKNTTFDVTNIGDAIIAYTTGTLMKNVDITADNVPYPIYLYGDAELDNVNLDIKNVGTYALYFWDFDETSNVTIKNCDFNLEDASDYFYIAFGSSESLFNVYNSKMKGTNINMFVDIDADYDNVLTFEKCDININNDDLMDDCLFGFLASELVIKDSDLKAKISGDGITTSNTITFDNSNISLESKSGITLAIFGDEDFDLDDYLILKNTNLRETSLLKRTLSILDSYVASLLVSEPPSSFDDYADAIALVSRAIHFDTINNPKTGDNLSYYIILTLLSIMTLSSCYYVLKREY